MDVLLTFTGFHDPYFKGLIDEEEQTGPILSLLSMRSFDHIFLFATPNTKRITQETKDAISKLSSPKRGPCSRSRPRRPHELPRDFEGAQDPPSRHYRELPRSQVLRSSRLRYSPYARLLGSLGSFRGNPCSYSSGAPSSFCDEGPPDS